MNIANYKTLGNMQGPITSSIVKAIMVNTTIPRPSNSDLVLVLFQLSLEFQLHSGLFQTCQLMSLVLRKGWLAKPCV